MSELEEEAEMNPITSEPILPVPAPPPPAPNVIILRDELGRLYEFPPECIPNVDELMMEDGKPVDNIIMERQYRLLVEPLYSSWRPSKEGRLFLAAANVRLFYKMREPPLVPGVMLSLDVKPGDPSQRENLSYISWIMGKPPNVVIEFVSDRSGGEESHKLQTYARIAVPYYVILDSKNLLGGGILRVFGLHSGTYEPIASDWLPTVELGLTLWSGIYQDLDLTWLRWCDRNGVVIPTGRERAEQERQRAEQERQHVERLMQKLRDAGIDPAS